MSKRKTITWKVGSKTAKATVRDELLQIHPTKRDTFVFQLDWEDFPEWIRAWILRNKKKVLADGRIKGWIGRDSDDREYEIAVMAGSLLLYVIDWS